MEGMKDILKEMLGNIYKAHPVDAKPAYEILIKLFQNILNNPNEPKFRNFKKTNETIKTKVLIIPEIIDTLQILGYSDSETNPTEIMVFEGDTLLNFQIAIDVLNDILNGAKGHKVIVYQYDLTNGLAKTMSPGLLGKSIEGVWHTAVCVYGKEYFYGGGIQIGQPKKTPYGYPVKELDMGYTQMEKDMFESYLKSIDNDFTPESYNVINHNCNHFTDAALFFLTGKNLPNPILKQHEQILSTPMGKMLMPMLQQMSGGNNSIPAMFEGNHK